MQADLTDQRSLAPEHDTPANPHPSLKQVLPLLDELRCFRDSRERLPILMFGNPRIRADAKQVFCICRRHRSQHESRWAALFSAAPLPESLAALLGDLENLSEEEAQALLAEQLA